MRIFNKSWRCANLSRHSVSDFGTNNTSEWRRRVCCNVQYRIVRVQRKSEFGWLFSSRVRPLFSLPPSPPLTLDSHRFATLLPHPSCGLATKQPACDTPHGKTAFMCISESTKASSEKERKKENTTKSAKNATHGFYPANSVTVSENNGGQ